MRSFVYKLGCFAILLTFVVIMLGAYTRLKDACLGCPDWPGCYGYLTVPKTSSDLLQASVKFPEIPFESNKAWTEMVHRYVAGTLGLLIFVLALFSFRKSPISSVAIVALVIFQALLGMWTVTLKLLPIVVMGHLMGGMAILAFLTWMTLRLKSPPAPLFQRREKNKEILKTFAIIGLIILVIQIALGGWVSSNYAALICTDFPTCQNQWLPQMDLKHAFEFWAPVGPNYQGGLLETPARVAIQVIHRLGALITFAYLAILSIWLIMRTTSHCLRKLAIGILMVLSLQVILGILNVLLLLPIGLAVAHNGVAALLLFLVTALNYALSRTV